MTAHAIVIGIDSYANSEWNLSGAVNDAIAFARWALSSGGVAPADLKLLLSPRDGTSPFDGGPVLRYDPATTDAIDAILERYTTRPCDATRLWVYYAGHGVLAPGDGPSSAPVLIPADENNLETYVPNDRKHINLERFRADM